MRSFSRRQLLGGSAALLGVGVTRRFVGAQPAPIAVVRSSQPSLPSTNERVLVVIQLSGGNDGLNTVVPASRTLYGQYAAARPQLKLLQRDLLTLDSGGQGAEVGLHPSLRPLLPWWQQGHLAIIQNTGNPTPNYSHFRSMEIWHTADPVGSSPSTSGWLAHALEHQAQAPGIVAASLGLSVPRALTGSVPLGISIDNLDDFQLAPLTDVVDVEAVRALLAHFGGSYAGAPLRERAAQTLALTVDATNRVATVTRSYAASRRKYVAAVTYPDTDVARRLKLTAQLIDANLGGRVYYVAMDGFDTHENQRATGADPQGHDALMRDLADAVNAFLNDLQMHGHAQRTTVMTFSEFGRRVGENGSRGTDHGSAGPMFVIGAPITGGLYGAPPILDPDHLIDDGNLPVAVDFRRAYATLLDSWLGVSSGAVLGANFAPLPFLGGAPDPVPPPRSAPVGSILPPSGVQPVPQPRSAASPAMGKPESQPPNPIPPSR